MMWRERLRVVAFATLAGLAAAALVSAALPRKYAAAARILVPPQAGEIAPFAELAASRDISVSAHGASRMLLVRHVSTDPRAAASVVNDFVAANAKRPMVVIDRASIPREPLPGLALNLAWGAVAGLALGFAFVALHERRQRPAPDAPQRIEPRPEDDSRVLAAEKGAYRELCEGLLRDWFASHPLLAIVGAGAREERANVAARLAVSFAELGAKTLLVDTELQRSAQGVQLKPVAGFEGLFLMLAPGERLATAIVEASRRFRVVLIDSPASDERHEFAALAGGALIVARPDAERAALEALEAALGRLPARVVGTVLNRA
jgi:hypothetical protein